MKLIAGLGNPGPRYQQTRHNVGFMVVDELARRWDAEVSRYDRDFEALIGDAQRAAERIALLKPQTFMNLSGRSVLAAQRFFKIDLPDVMIVCDDLDLPLGGLRMRAGGSGGGHNGLTDVIQRLGSLDIPRLRTGIGRSERYSATGFVLGAFMQEEREEIARTLETAADALECWISDGIDAAMTRYNRRRNEASGRQSEGESD